MKKVVVLGAGYAGILAAKQLAKKVKKAKLQDVEITLIDKNPFTTMLTELHEVAAQRVREDSIRISIERSLAGRNVKFAHEKIASIDFDAQVLTSEKGTRNYDYLVFAAGAKAAYFGVPGAQEFSFPLWSYDDSVKLRDHIENMFRLAAMEPDLAKKRELLTFFTVGAGFTGVEMAGELAEFAPFICDRYEIDPELVTMVIVDMMDRVCTALPDKSSGKVTNRLEKTKCKVMLKTSIKAIGEDFIEYEQNGQLTRVKTRTVMWTAGIEGADIALSSAEALGNAGRGRMHSNDFLQSQNYPNVYIAGDNLFYTPEGHDSPVPQMVENAEYSAATIVDNLMVDLSGKGEKQKYKPSFHGMMVCIGGRWGTAYGGLPGKFMAIPSFPAMLAKHTMNMPFIINTLGWNKVFAYLRNEFFTIRNKRSILGGHFSNRGPLFLMTPLRMLLGMYLIYYGNNRMSAGWLSEPKLKAMFDAIATSPPRASLFSMDIFNQIRMSASVVNDTITMWVQTTPVSWFLESFVVNSPSNELFWQYIIIGIHFICGAMMMAGLFTTVAALTLIASAVVVVMTIGLGMTYWWVPVSAIGFMFIGGRVLSLDYYVIPWLHKKWKNINFVKKWYLYHNESN